MIQRRHILFIAGYDPVGALNQHRLFCRELPKFEQTWNVRATASELRDATSGQGGHWTIDSGAGDWHVASRYEPLLWDDIVRSDLSRSWTRRLGRVIPVFASFALSGTAFRYVRANYKYALFFLYPFAVLAAFAAVAAWAAAWATGFFGLSGVPGWGFGLLLTVGVFIGLIAFPGRRLRIGQALDDWIFSWEFVLGRRPDLDERLDRFAERLTTVARDPATDEVVVIGHSLGATLAVEVVARALARDAQLGLRGPSVCLLTVGSTIPKFTLHPKGGWLRRSIATLVGAPALAWTEYQARDDAISFYKFDPATSERIDDDRVDGKPLIRRVQMHQMLSPESVRRHHWRFMRLHYQFVMGNERRSGYDYFMMVCGPIPFAQVSAAPAGPAGLIAADGAFRPATQSDAGSAPSGEGGRGTIRRADS